MRRYTRLKVHCRTGSLETIKQGDNEITEVHCRTGSLESSDYDWVGEAEVHCRTGSLESISKLC
ncbi:hypothetical protein PCIT_b0899 [Pseudoalteromonas citrea]|uniref:Uncharacterized protein n=2 Tax=Pseudoalteromonas citrea TaxID=43655 RepID=A0AAD4FQ84_9GAMM|nr:hypothetical protein PCIT_b0899 [Pseudoalteromonas citrea]